MLTKKDLYLIHKALGAVGEYMMEIGQDIDDRNYTKDVELLDKAIDLIWKELTNE